MGRLTLVEPHERSGRPVVESLTTGAHDFNRAISRSNNRQTSAWTSLTSPYSIAGLYADLGDKEHAFAWLNTAYQEHDSNIIALRTDFAMDSLHSDPRYAELVRKIGLPQ